MSKFNDEMSLKLAWQTAYELRTCPDEDALYSENIDANLQKHLSICHACREKRAMDPEERKAWKTLQAKFAGATMQPATDIAKQAGQVWMLGKHHGGWRDDGRFTNQPSVLLLDKIPPASWKVAQLYHDKRLMGVGDVPLNGRFGFAEGWNCYSLKEDRLACCLGVVSAEEGESVLAASMISCEPAEEGSFLSYFRMTEIEVGVFVAVPTVVKLEEEWDAIPDTKEPIRFKLVIQTIADWFRPLLSPVPMTAAAAIVAIICLAILNSSKVKESTVAQTPTPAQTPPTITTLGKQTPAQLPPDIKRPEKQKIPAYVPTLTASADAVLNSKSITKIIITEQESFSFSGNIDPNRAAYQIGIAFVDFAAAIKRVDAIGYDYAVSHLNKLIPVLAEKTSIIIPPANADKYALAQFAVELEKVAAKVGQVTTLRFGSWLQSSRLADDVHLLAMVDSSVIEYFRNNLAVAYLTPSVESAFDKLLSLSNLKKSDLAKLRAALQDLCESF